MEASWVSLLIQVPLVGVFVWFSLEMSKRNTEAQRAFMEALDKRDAAYEKRNQAVIETINLMNQSVCAQLQRLGDDHDEHDRFVRERLASASAKTKG